MTPLLHTAQPTSRTAALAACLAAVVSLGHVATAHVQADEWSELQRRFAARDPQLQQLKAAGTLGETSSGYLEPPDAALGVPPLTPEARQLMDDENADRRRLYALIGRRENVPPEVVADRAARRNFARARTGEWLKFPDGLWRQKP
ncbi:MAG: YdbL family protein [Tepidisphaerales bacterium]